MPQNNRLIKSSRKISQDEIWWCLFFWCKNPSMKTVAQLFCHLSIVTAWQTIKTVGNTQATAGMTNWMGRRPEIEALFPTFEGNKDPGCSQNLIAPLIPKSQTRQHQEGMERPQSFQLHSGKTSKYTKSCLPSLTLQWQIKKKWNKNKKHLPKQVCFCLSIYVTRQTSSSLETLRQEREITPRFLKAP